jgi:hypothetical protein
MLRQERTKNIFEEQTKMSQDSVDSSEGQHKNANREENVSAAPSVEQLRKRAFELFVARQHAGIYGSDTEDWLQAERELGNT